jgi:hypothetical protein
MVWEGCNCGAPHRARMTDGGMAPLGKSLIFVGIVLVAVGLTLWGGARVPMLNRLGRLPGDIYLRRDHFSFYFPPTTPIAISLILSLLFMLLRR